MTTMHATNKVKIAKRVIEVFECIDQCGSEVTVMDIVRRYGRPQSSTSELLSSLVEMGLLYKDPQSRCYTPTPRIAALGTSGQPEMIRDGGLFTYMDRLAQSTGKTVALFGMVDTNVQIFRLSAGADSIAHKIAYGACAQISASTAGLLLLSTFAPEQAARTLWRLKAEVEDKFDLAELKDRVARFRRQGHAIGTAGFAPGLQVATTLLPRSRICRPLALGVFYRFDIDIDTKSMITTMNTGISDLNAPRTSDHTTPLSEPYQMAG